MKTVLVTGAAGFIASRLARRLLEAGIRVVAVDNLNDAYDQRMKHHRLAALQQRDGFTFVEADIENLYELEPVFATHRFNAIYNLAARAGVRYSIEDPHVYLRSNAQGALNLMELMHRHDCGKLVLASTSSLYAGQPMPFREDLPVEKPLSPYAASNTAAEVLSYTYHHLYGIDVTILRYFTVYGPAGRPDMAPFRFIKWIHAGTPITVFGDGSQTRDFTYVDDIVEGVVRVMDKTATPNPAWDGATPDPGTSSAPYRLFNIGNNNPVMLTDFIAAIEKALGKTAERELLPMQPGDVAATYANIEDLIEAVDYRPQTPVQVGIDNFVAWYMQHMHKE